MAKANNKKQKKAPFIRKFLPSVSAKDVVAAAKKAGIKISENYVYNVRAARRASPAKKPKNKLAVKFDLATDDTSRNTWFFAHRTSVEQISGEDGLVLVGLAKKYGTVLLQQMIDVLELLVRT
jgi:hypothetical protein